MFESYVVKLAFQGLLMILILSGPPVLIGMFCGLAVAIFQTATQIQEQTLSIAVKLVAVTLTLLVLGAWLGSTIWEFASTIFSNFPRWIEL